MEPRQESGKPEGNQTCQHQPLPTGVPEGREGCLQGDTKPWYPGQALLGTFVMTFHGTRQTFKREWPKFTPPLHKMRTASSQQRRYHERNNQLKNKCIILLTSLGNKQLKSIKWARILLLLPYLQTAVLVLCGAREQEDKLAAPCPG